VIEEGDEDVTVMGVGEPDHPEVAKVASRDRQNWGTMTSNKLNDVRTLHTAQLTTSEDFSTS